jgi:CIC family chloride channel protein
LLDSVMSLEVSASVSLPASNPGPAPFAAPWAVTLWLFFLAMLGGAVAGVLGASFRFALASTGHVRDALVAYAHGLGAFGWLLPVVTAAGAVALSRLLLRLEPVAGGSGIQYAEAVARGLLAPQLHILVIPVKFVGGVLSIGAGLALGREGPTVQMAARVGALLVRLGRLAVEDARMLRSAVAGAGLGVAFNALLGGAVFVFEELWRGFPARLVACTLVACAVAITVSRLMLGNHADFPVPDMTLPPAAALVPALLLGAALGLIGALYNRALIAAIEAFARPRIIPELKAAAIGGATGLIAWYLPEVVGGGEALIVPLLHDGGSAVLANLAGILVLRLLLSPVSYAAGTPGGLFAPVLVIGALVGALGLRMLDTMGLGFGLSVTGAVLVGMTAFLTAVMRSPLTAIALVIEMSQNASHLVPMLAACFAAIAVCELVRSEPIYDTLIDRIPEARAAEARMASANRSDS